MQTTRTFIAVLLMIMCSIASGRAEARPNSSVMYQGQLKVDGVPFDGSARFEFSLWDAATSGREVAPMIGMDLDVMDGLFIASLDFGDAAFNGDPRWLAIQVDTGRGFLRLDPRQQVTPAPYALMAQKTMGVDGHSLDSSDGALVDEVFVDAAGNVGVGTTSPRGKLDVNGLLQTSSLRLTEAPSAGHVLTSDASGNGTWQAPPSGGSSLWSEDRGDIYYLRGNVGIGTSTPTTTLDVAGGLSVEAFRMGDRIPAGRVLTSDANGVGTWQSLPTTADPIWGQSGSQIYYDGQVGIGTTNPLHPLQVEGNSASLIRAHNTSVAGEYTALYGECDSPDCRAIKGVASYTNGDPAGVFGQSSSPYGMGVYGRNLDGGYGVYGEGDTADGGWAGYFSGRGYFSGNVGIGDSTPQEKLDVNGTVKMNGLKVGTSATVGHVLTASADGTATWQAPPSGGGSFQLPYTGSVDTDGTHAFKITNTGSGVGTTGLAASITNSGTGESYAGSFNVTGAGIAVRASNSGASTTVYATNSGTGKVMYAKSTSGDGAEFRSGKSGGYAVKGDAYNTSGLSTGGWFESEGSTGRAVYATATGGQGIGLKVETTGAESYAIDASSPYYGMYVSGGVKAARFNGKIDVKSRTSNAIVFSVGNDGMTTVDVLHIAGGSDLAERFDVTAEAKPGMVVTIDPDHPGKLQLSRHAYDRRVAGVISGANDLGVGMVLADLPDAENSMPVALSGRVWVFCDATQHAIQPGDLLTSSDRSGYAMAVQDHSRAVGAVIGKAMSSLDKGEAGMVLVLVNLQ